MASRNWSSSFVRIFLLVAGVLVILEAVHALSVTVTLNKLALSTLALDVRNIHNVPGIAAGLVVGMLALVPSRRNKSRKVSGAVPRTWGTINSVQNIQHLLCLANAVADHSDIR